MKIKCFIALLSIAALVASCDNKTVGPEPETPQLHVEQPTIEAGWSEGSYSVAVTSNVEWSTLMSENTGWCSLDVEQGEADGEWTLIVNVKANETSSPRRVVITISETKGSLSEDVTVEQKAFTTPTHAMTKQTWTVGEGAGTQMWSDEINIPECNKTDFAGGGTPTEPISDCRDNFGNADYGFLYTAEYVVQNAELLCPDGWRVPSYEDFVQLDKNLGGNGTPKQDADGELRYNGSLWGGNLGGLAMAELSANPAAGARAYYRGLPPVYMAELLLMYDNWGVWIDQNMYSLGCQVRCVK